MNSTADPPLEPLPVAGLAVGRVGEGETDDRVPVCPGAVRPVAVCPDPFCPAQHSR
jgi:hypothetical protein